MKSCVYEYAAHFGGVLETVEDDKSQVHWKLFINKETIHQMLYNNLHGDLS